MSKCLHTSREAFCEHAVSATDCKFVLQETSIISRKVEFSTQIYGEFSLMQFESILLNMQYCQFRARAIYD